MPMIKLCTVQDRVSLEQAWCDSRFTVSNIWFITMKDTANKLSMMKIVLLKSILEQTGIDSSWLSTTKYTRLLKLGHQGSQTAKNQELPCSRSSLEQAGNDSRLSGPSIWPSRMTNSQWSRTVLFKKILGTSWKWWYYYSKLPCPFIWFSKTKGTRLTKLCHQD